MTAMTLNPINVLDASAATKPMSAYTDGTNDAFAHVVLDQTTGLPVSPATSGNQAAGNSSLATIATNTGNIPAKGSATSANSLPVVIASDQGALPLPTGAATSANQTTGNTSLATIATNTTGVATAANQTTGNTSLATIATNTTGASTSALQTTGNTTLSSILTATQAATPAGTNLIGYANGKDPAAATGNITAADAATTTASNSVTQSVTNGTPTANSSFTATLSAHSGVTLQLSGTFTGTVAFERSVDGGTTFVPFSLEEVAVGAAVSSLTISDNKAYVLRGNAGALTTVRVRCTAYTSGTLAVLVQPGFGAGMVIANQGTPNATNPWTQNLTQVAGSAIAQGHGAASTAIRVELPTDGTGVVGLNAGTNLIGSVSLAASTAGGTSTYSATGGTGNALLTNTAVAVKASAGNLYGVNFVNTGTADAYVQVFDLAVGSVTLGTTAPKLSFWVPAGGAWEEKFTDEAKVTFATAITVAATTTTTGSTAPSTGVLANIVYK